MEQLGFGSVRESVEDILAKASRRVGQILDRERRPKLLQHAQHEYEDKYLLVEKSTLSSVKTFVEILDLLGLDKDQLWTFAKNTRGQKQRMRFSAWQRCEFISHTEVKVENPHSAKVSGDTNCEYTTYTKIDEYTWLVTLQYAITIQSQLGEERLEVEAINGRTEGCEIVTRTDERPAAEEEHFQQDCDVTFVFDCLKEDKTITFSIDRTANSCKTPRRNEEIAAAESFCEELQGFTKGVFEVLEQLALVTQNNDMDKNPLKEVSDRLKQYDILIPVVPFLEEKENDGKGTTFSYQDLDLFLREFRVGTQKLLEDLNGLAASITDGERRRSTLKVDVNEYRLVALMQLCNRVAAMTYLTGEMVEQAITQQVIDSIGEVCTAEKFNECMTFHNKILYRTAFAPKPFVHEVRRAGHAPDGALSLELKGKHVYTTCRSRRASLSEDTTEGVAGAMRFALNAAVDVKMYGQQNLHGLMMYQFSKSTLDLRITARARQFSSFVLMIGTVSGPCRFEPKYSMVVRNKDSVIIPLLTKIVPSAQEFKDAIESLSPEQQNFAKAFREMQLGSTVMGIVLMPIRPLLEQVLQISPGSLTKEIKLSQDLMALFVEHQIPTDLLAYAGPSGATAAQKVERVKEHVAAVKGMIQEAKDEEAKMRKQEAEEAEDRYLRGEFERPDSRYYATDSMPAPPPQDARVHKSRLQRVPMACVSLLGAEPNEGNALFAKEESAGNASLGAQSSAPGKKFMATAQHQPKPAAVLTATRQLAEPFGGSVHVDSVIKEAGDSSKAESRPKKEEWEEVDGEELVPKDALNFTQIPKRLDEKYRDMEEGSQVRPVTLKPKENWVRKRKPGLIGRAETELLHKGELEAEHHQTLDLLDALSRSGELPLTDTTLHVIIPLAHSFDKTVMETVVQENENPVHKLEWTQLVLNETIHEVSRSELLKPAELKRLDATSKGSLTDVTSE